MPRRGENIRKRKDGRWEGRYIQGYDSGTNKAKYISIYGKTYSEVRQKLEDAKYKQRQGQQQTQHVHKRFGELAQEWLLQQKPFLKPASLAKYRNLMETHIFPHLGHLLLKDLSQAQFQDFLMQQSLEGNRSTGGSLSVSTLQSLLHLLQAVLEYGAARNLLVRFPLSLPVRMVKPAQVQTLTPRDEDKLDQYLSSHPSDRNLGILLSLYCGLRLGEVCGLQWQDMDLRLGILQVQRTVQRIPCEPQSGGKRTKLEVSSPKTHTSRRRIPLPGFLLALLRSFAAKSAPAYYIVSGKDSPMEPRLYQYYFQQVLEKAGVARINYHALRHTFATNCVALGFDCKTLSEILGHSNVSITLNRYVHPTLSQKKGQMEYLDAVKGQIYGHVSPSAACIPAAEAVCP